MKITKKLVIISVSVLLVVITITAVVVIYCVRQNKVEKDSQKLITARRKLFNLSNRFSNAISQVKTCSQDQHLMDAEYLPDFYSKQTKFLAYFEPLLKQLQKKARDYETNEKISIDQINDTYEKFTITVNQCREQSQELKNSYNQERQIISNQFVQNHTSYLDQIQTFKNINFNLDFYEQNHNFTTQKDQLIKKLDDYVDQYHQFADYDSLEFFNQSKTNFYVLKSEMDNLTQTFETDQKHFATSLLQQSNNTLQLYDNFLNHVIKLLPILSKSKTVQQAQKLKTTWNHYQDRIGFYTFNTSLVDKKNQISAFQSQAEQFKEQILKLYQKNYFHKYNVKLIYFLQKKDLSIFSSDIQNQFQKVSKLELSNNGLLQLDQITPLMDFFQLFEEKIHSNNKDFLENTQDFFLSAKNFNDTLDFWLKERIATLDDQFHLQLHYLFLNLNDQYQNNITIFLRENWSSFLTTLLQQFHPKDSSQFISEQIIHFFYQAFQEEKEKILSFNTTFYYYSDVNNAGLIPSPLINWCSKFHHLQQEVQTLNLSSRPWYSWLLFWQKFNNYPILNKMLTNLENFQQWQQQLSNDNAKLIPLAITKLTRDKHNLAIYGWIINPTNSWEFKFNDYSSYQLPWSIFQEFSSFLEPLSWWDRWVSCFCSVESMLLKKINQFIDSFQSSDKTISDRKITWFLIQLKYHLHAIQFWSKITQLKQSYQLFDTFLTTNKDNNIQNFYQQNYQTELKEIQDFLQHVEASKNDLLNQQNLFVTYQQYQRLKEWSAKINQFEMVFKKTFNSQNLSVILNPTCQFLNSNNKNMQIFNIVSKFNSFARQSCEFNQQQNQMQQNHQLCFTNNTEIVLDSNFIQQIKTVKNNEIELNHWAQQLKQIRYYAYNSIMLVVAKISSLFLNLGVTFGGIFFTRRYYNQLKNLTLKILSIIFLIISTVLLIPNCQILYQMLASIDLTLANFEINSKVLQVISMIIYHLWTIIFFNYCSKNMLNKRPQPYVRKKIE